MEQRFIAWQAKGVIVNNIQKAVLQNYNSVIRDGEKAFAQERHFKKEQEKGFLLVLWGEAIKN